MSLETLTQDQKDFISKYLKSGFFTKRSNARKVERYETYLADQKKYAAIAPLLPVGTQGLAAATLTHDTAEQLLEQGKIKKAHVAMAKAHADVWAAEIRLNATSGTLEQQLDALTLSEDATDEERDFFDTCIATGKLSFVERYASPADLETARTELGKAAAIVARMGALKSLAARDPLAAGAAHLAFETMRETTGGGKITPERIDAAKQTRETAMAEMLRCETALRQAIAMPTDTPDNATAQNTALAQAIAEKRQADQALEDARKMEKALVGTQLLAGALLDGPLSGKSTAPKMPANTRMALIAAFETHPEVANQAVGIAASASDPAAVAHCITALGNTLDNGLRDQDGRAPAVAIDTETYTNQVLTMAGVCGTSYVDRLDDYVTLGGLTTAAPLPDDPTDSTSQRGVKRSMAMAQDLMSDTGALSLGTDEAKTAVGHMLFHPDALNTPTPSLNKQVVKTLDMLSTDPELSRANTVLTGITPPRAGAGQTLIRAAVGKDPQGTVNATDAEARQVVLSSFLQTVDQGPVGSCFATAPVRRMRETDPMKALDTFRDLAVNGTLTTASGVDVPAVANIPPGEDPLVRSFEYTLATAVGRDDAMQLQTQLKARTNDAAYAMQTALPPTIPAPTAANFLAAINAEFTTVFDPNVQNGVVAADESSDRGRYVLIDSTGTAITTRIAYLGRAEAVALNASGYARNSVEGAIVLATVQNDFMAHLDRQKYPPWQLQDGGRSEETMTVFGDAGIRTEATPEMTAPPTTPQDVGTRTKAILTGMIANFGPAPEDMIQCDTKTHDFNLLPKDPSMVAFLSGLGSTASKIQSKLVNPGKDLAARKLSVKDAQQAFDAVLNPEIEQLKQKSEDTDASSRDRRKATSKLKKLRTDVAKCRPTTELNPEELTKTIEEAVKRVYAAPYFRMKAQGQIAQTFAEPQIVLADTNWGDAGSHIYFVIAPDPLSGEPMMWKKEDPPGTLTPLSGRWLQSAWGVIR